MKHYVQISQHKRNSNIFHRKDNIGIIIHTKDNRYMYASIDKYYIVNGIMSLIESTKYMNIESELIFYDRNKFLFDNYIISLIYELSKELIDERDIIKLPIDLKEESTKCTIGLDEIIIGDKKIDIRSSKDLALKLIDHLKIY